MSNKYNLVKVGEVSIDSGTVMIADPHNVLDQQQHMRDFFKENGYDENLANNPHFQGTSYKRLLQQEELFRKTHPDATACPVPSAFDGEGDLMEGNGVVSCGFGGDGTASIFHFQNNKGSVKIALVVFSEDQADIQRDLVSLAKNILRPKPVKRKK